MLKTIKKILKVITFIFITIFISVFSSNFRANDNSILIDNSTYSFPKFSEKTNLDFDGQWNEELVKNINLDKYINSFDFYFVNQKGGEFIVGDVLNEIENDGVTVESKIVLAPSLYDFGKFNYLKNENAVFEIIENRSNVFTKNFYILNNDEVNKFESVAENFSNDDEKLYSRLISSIAFESSFKQSFLSISTKTVIDTTLSTNNQALLDDYLVNFKQNNNNLINTSDISGNVDQTIYAYDDSIVNLIPKSVFTSNGIWTKSGIEWGLFCKDI